MGATPLDLSFTVGSSKSKQGGDNRKFASMNKSVFLKTYGCQMDEREAGEEVGEPQAQRRGAVGVDAV